MKEINQNRSTSQGDCGKVTWAQVSQKVSECVVQGQSTAAEMPHLANELAEAAMQRAWGQLRWLASA